MNTTEIRSFRKSLRKFEQLLLLQQESCCTRVTLAQCHVLLEIENLGNTTTGELADRLRLDKSTLSRTVDALVTLGQVEREIKPDDRRYTNLSLTVEGKKTSQIINTEADQFYVQVFDRISDKKHKGVIESFNLLVQAMGEIDLDAECDNYE